MNDTMRGAMTGMTAADEHAFQAYHVAAAGARGRRGGLVVVQEIFGVNSHIQSVSDRFAAQGYEVYAPALFDRVERGFEAGYEEADIQTGIALMQKADLTNAVLDVQACIDALRANGDGKVGVVGYCWGGTVAWAAACRAIGVAAAVPYYGGAIANHLDLTPNCPVMMHFGEHDASIPMDKVDLIRESQSDPVYHVYDAEHGFNCEQRASYNEAAANLALGRTLDFFATHIG